MTAHSNIPSHVLARGLLPALELLITVALLGMGCRASPSLTQTQSGQATLTIPDVVTHNQLSKQVVLNPIPAGVQGNTGVAFARTGDLRTPPLERAQNEELELTEGEPLSLYVILLNSIGKPRTFLVTALLDYKQVPFELDGQGGLLHEVVVPSPAVMNLPLRMTVGGTGAHDLIFVAFADPYDHPLDASTRENEQGNIEGRRAVVVVGGQNEPVRTLTPAAFGKDSPANLPLVPIRIGFASAPNRQTTHPSERYIVFTKANLGQKFSYQIWATNFGNTRKETFNYALVGFLDFHQVDLIQPDVTIAQVGSGQEAILDASVNLPNTKAIHEFQVVYVFDPFKSILHHEVLAPFVLSSLRLGLDTQ